MTHFFLFLAPVIPNLNSVYLFQRQSHLWVLSPLRMHDSVWCLWQVNVHLCCLRLLVSWCARWALGSAGAVWLLVVRFPVGMGTETRYLIGLGAKLWKTGVSISSDVNGSAIGTGEIKKTHIHLLLLYTHYLANSISPESPAVFI